MRSLAFIHSENSSVPAWPQGLSVWTTCRRSIAFLNHPHAEKNWDIPEPYHGDNALQFLLEVLCGLHSPIKGETEVLGQFRDWIFAQLELQNPWVMENFSDIQKWLGCVKSVREKYLHQMGAQGYGSWIRSELRGIDKVEVIGAGQWVKENWPWIVEGRTRSRVWVRSKLKRELPNAEVVQIDEWFDHKSSEFASTWIIAAPIEHSDLIRRIEHAGGNVKTVIDLRANSSDMFLSVSSIKHRTLKNLFDDVSQTSELLQKRVELAKHSIEQWIRSQQERVWIRPYGWEDL